MNGDLNVWLILGGGLLLAFLGKQMRSDLLYRLGNLVMFPLPGRDDYERFHRPGVGLGALRGKL